MVTFVARALGIISIAILSASSVTAAQDDLAIIRAVVTEAVGYEIEQGDAPAWFHGPFGSIESDEVDDGGYQPFECPELRTANGDYVAQDIELLQSAARQPRLLGAYVVICERFSLYISPPIYNEGRTRALIAWEMFLGAGFGSYGMVGEARRVGGVWFFAGDRRTGVS